MHMVDLPLDAARLTRFAWNRGHGKSADDDFGYAAHAWLSAVFGEHAPRPFRLNERRDGLRLLGYTSVPIETLREHAETFAEPEAMAVCDWRHGAGKAMPKEWRAGRRLGFELRACPVSRGERERDVFLVAVDRGKAASQEIPSRQEVYGDWLFRQFDRDAAAVVEPGTIRLIGFRRLRVARRRHGGVDNGRHRSLERPDALFSGELAVSEPRAFNRLLERGIGRHRAFGFGMLLLRPAASGI